MFFSRQTSRSVEALRYCTLLALCTLAFFYHFWTSTTTIYQDIQHMRLSSSLLLSASIPKILWYKLGPVGLNNDTQAWTDTCIAANPDYDIQFLTDEDAENFVYTAFSGRPDILDAYLGLTVPILKADMLRYMLLYDQGGIWSDLDVSCEDTPIDEWIPPSFRDRAGLVVGWEFDVGWSPYVLRQFASWTVMASPGSPHMLTVIEGIVDALKDVTTEYGVDIGDVTLNMTGDVVDFSGARRLTTGVFQSLEFELNRTVSPDEAKEILQPVLLGDVLIMPGRSFAASMNNYAKHGGGSGLLPPQLVTHHYAGTWKNDQGGEQFVNTSAEHFVRG